MLDLFRAQISQPIKPKLSGSARFSGCKTLRYEIRRWWVDEPKRWAVWLMLNPSNAGAEQMDPTAQRVTHFSRSWGLDGWIGVNLYPLISSTPAEMWRWAAWDVNGPDYWARDRIHDNLNFVEAAGRAAIIRVAAFGAQPVEHDDGWLEEAIEAFTQPSSMGAGETLNCLGTNKTGQPLHPMARGKWRVPDDRQPIVWRL